MARIDNLENFLTDVAESIRGKTESTKKIKPENFDTEIANIKTGDDLNVFVQENEPDIKDGVWIQSNENSKAIIFNLVGASEGGFLDTQKLNDVLYNEGTYAFRIVNDYLYLFSTLSGSSKKFNLNTYQFEEEINVPTLSSVGGIGSLVYDNKIYVFYHSSGTIYYYIYDYVNNTYSEPTNLGNVRRFNNTNWISNIVTDGTNAYFIAATYTSSDHYYDIVKIVLSTMKMTTTQKTGDMFRNNNNITYYNRCIYFTAYSSSYGKKTIKVLNCDSLSISDLCTVSLGTSGSHYTLCAYNGFIYVFQSGVSVTEYAKVDITNKTFEILETPFEIRTNAQASHPDIFQFHEASGIMYGFYKYSETTPKCLAIQLIVNYNYEDGTIFITQSNTLDNKVKISNSSNLNVGIDNTYIVKNNQLDCNHTTYLGNGEKWTLFKNEVVE